MGPPAERLLPWCDAECAHFLIEIAALQAERLGGAGYVAAGLFEAMGNASQLPAAMAAWAPDLIFGLLGGYLLLKVPT